MTATQESGCTELHIGVDQTIVTRRHGRQPHTRMVLLIGSEKTASDFFQHTPATLLEMENAIMAVEDEVMRTRALTLQGSVLHTRDAAIREVAQRAGVADSASMVLSVEAVERQFDLLTALIMGRPASSAGIPTDARFAATLLILREFMHHMQFPSITIASSPA